MPKGLERAWETVRRVARNLWERTVRTTAKTVRSLRKLPRRSVRATRWTLLAIGVLLLAVILLDVLLDEPIRRSVERRMNAALDGYTVAIAGADFSPWNFSLELEGLVVTQDAHPEVPVLDLALFRFSVQWRALLALRLVADAELVRPRLAIDLERLREERSDEVDLDDRGWQQAVKEAYPLEINQLGIADGSLTYVHDDPERPLRITDLDAVARDIRNVYESDEPLPSPFEARAAVFETGSARIGGRADFLAEPVPAFAARAELDDVPLEELGPVIEGYRLRVAGGALSARGEVEYGAERKRVDVEEVAIAGIRIDYLSDPEMTRRAVEAVTEAKREPTVEIDVRTVRLADSEIGFVNQARDPGYRAFLSGVDATFTGWSNREEQEPSRFTLRGAFMGSGATAVDGTFRPDADGADFDLAVAIEGTRLTDMNDLLRSHANLDVVGGSFSFYSELRVAGGSLDGYVKPLFHEADVYDPEQDEDEGFFHQLWERIAEGLGEVLENRPREEVVTVADLSGSVSDPDASNLQVVLNLIENAFFEAILPGFRDQADD